VRSNCLSLGRKLYMVFPLPEQTKLHLTSPDMLKRRKGQTFDDENSSTGPRWKLNPCLQYYCRPAARVPHAARLPLESLFTARYALPEYSPRAITDFLEFLKPDNCKVFVSGFGTDESHMCTFLSPDGKLCCEPDGPNFCSMEKLKPELIATCSAAWPSSSCEFDTELKLPKTESQPQGPRLLRFEAGPHTPAARFWFQQDNRLQTPIVFISVDLVTSPEPLVTDCASSVMLDIFVVLLVDQLNSLESQAKQVDLRLKVSRSKQGIQARRKISALEAQKTHKTDLCKSQLAMLLNSACSWHWSYQDKRVAINETTLESFMIFVQRFSSQIQLSSQPQRLVSEDEDEEDKRTDAAVAPRTKKVVEESSAPRCQQTLQEEQDQQQKQQIPRQLFCRDFSFMANATAKDAEAASQIILNALPSPTQRTTERQHLKQGVIPITAYQAWRNRCAKEIPTTVQEQHDSHWRSITHGVLRFDDRDANLAKCLDAVVGGIKKDFLLKAGISEPAQAVLHHRISRAAFPDGISEADYADYPGTIIRNRNLFKQSLLLSPLPSGTEICVPNSDV
uniref:Peptidase_M16_M domain-containing protein n=1 Tax=Macrostomum lignano TaxID=282301 RepID=A0A1I8FTY7_9PLAT